ncbi:hypothetical protein [Oceanirhabdus seepicola]|uniref:Uncharacterized protein n=1 Tax=Oceanirhabdus seepicola TaxID=2828781 RepID=A0A9J6NX81_9CLOT|nr:hypothetical protein [Oceanirhabdus seepicola]MCM1988606.1 hypothetical protein [Oceanirhabdus seepicola]
MDNILKYLNNLSEINTIILTLLIVFTFISFNILAKVIIENMHVSYNSTEVSKKINRIYFNYIYTSISVIIVIFNLILLCCNFDSFFIGGIITLAETVFYITIIYLVFRNMIGKEEFQIKNRIFGVIEIFFELIF